MHNSFCKAFPRKAGQDRDIAAILRDPIVCQLLPGKTDGESYMQVSVMLAAWSKKLANSVLRRLLLVASSLPLPSRTIGVELNLSTIEEEKFVARVRIYVLTPDLSPITRVENLLSGPYETKDGQRALVSSPHPAVSCIWYTDPREDGATDPHL